LRDFACECVAVYVEYSIKHATEEELEKNPINIKSLLKRLYLMCIHTDALKRLGASLIFHRIVRLVREHDSLLDQFTFEILDHLFTCLKMSHAAFDAIAQSPTQRALEAYAQILIKRKELFLTSTRDRKPVSHLKEPVLHHFIMWLFQSSVTGLGIYSRSCFNLFLVVTQETACKSISY
jgi:DNA-dependent protein kinase catalytic subunit